MKQCTRALVVDRLQIFQKDEQNNGEEKISSSGVQKGIYLFRFFLTRRFFFIPIMKVECIHSSFSTIFFLKKSNEIVP